MNIPYVDLLSHNVGLSKNKKLNSHRPRLKVGEGVQKRLENATENIELTL